MRFWKRKHERGRWWGEKRGRRRRGVVGLLLHGRVVDDDQGTLPCEFVLMGANHAVEHR
jgi:hypothetical protein